MELNTDGLACTAGSGRWTDPDTVPSWKTNAPMPGLPLETQDGKLPATGGVRFWRQNNTVRDNS